MQRILRVSEAQIPWFMRVQIKKKTLLMVRSTMKAESKKVRGNTASNS